MGKIFLHFNKKMNKAFIKASSIAYQGKIFQKTKISKPLIRTRIRKTLGTYEIDGPKLYWQNIFIPRFIASPVRSNIN